MTLKFIQECMSIDSDAAGLYNNKALEVIDTSDPAICRHLSLLLQIIAIEYKGVFVRQIESSMGGGTLSIKEKSDQAFSHAIDSDPSSLFPQPEVLDNVYYLIWFWGIRPRNMPLAWQTAAQDSSVCCCLLRTGSMFVTKMVSCPSWQSSRMSLYQLGWYRRRNARMVCDTLMASASNSLLQ